MVMTGQAKKKKTDKGDPKKPEKNLRIILA